MIAIRTDPRRMSRYLSNEYGEVISFCGHDSHISIGLQETE